MGSPHNNPDTKELAASNKYLGDSIVKAAVIGLIGAIIVAFTTLLFEAATKSEAENSKVETTVSGLFKPRKSKPKQTTSAKSNFHRTSRSVHSLN